MTMEKPIMLEKEAPVKGIVAQVVTMLNGQAQRASLPVRTARLLQRSRTQTPSDAGISDGSASPAPAPASLLQDVVDIKTLLLQLKRVLQEPGEEHHSMSSETLDPLLAACAESPARGNGRRPPASPLHPDACAEMRRQILYLQSQLEERDRLVRVLQQQMLRMAESHEPRQDDTCNVATQTDRLRPPMSSALTSSDNSGLVSWNEQASVRKLPSYSEAQKTKRPVTNGTVNKCQCGVRKVNGHNNGDEIRAEPVQLRTSSRVGSKYLQAVAGDGRRSPGPAGQSTDTDCSSDGGYKSLPSSINCSASPKKVSGIPRRSIEQKFLSTKHVKASAI